MNWDYAERRTRARNYRIMFKSALAFLAFGVVLTILGGIQAFVAADNVWLLCGLVSVLFAGSSAYLTVDSTVRLIELDQEEGPGPGIGSPRRLKNTTEEEHAAPGS